MKHLHLNPPYKSLLAGLLVLFFSITARATVTGNAVSTIFHNTSSTSNSVVNYYITLSNGWVQGTSSITSLQLLDVTTGGSTLVYTHSGSSTNYGTVSNLAPGIYRFSGTVSTLESGSTVTVTISDYIWVGYKVEWENSFDMQEGNNPYSVKRSLTSPSTTYSYAQSYNLITSTTADYWIELRKSGNDNGYVYWVLEPLSNPSTFTPSMNITYIEFKTVSGATTVTLKYKLSGGTYTTSVLSTNSADKFRIYRKSGATSIQMNASTTAVKTLINITGDLKVTVLATAIGNEAIDIASSFGYPSTALPLITSYNSTTQTGSIVNNISPVTGSVSPYHYLISDKPLPTYSSLYKSVKDSIFGGTLDSVKFFGGNVAGLQYTHNDLPPGNYFLAAYDSRGVRVYNGATSIAPFTYETRAGFSSSGNMFVCAQGTAKATFENYLTDQQETAELLYYSSKTTSAQYFGLMNTGSSISSQTDIQYGFYVVSGNAYLVQAGVVGTTAYSVSSYGELKMVKNGSQLEYWIAGSLRATATLPDAFVYKTGAALTELGTHLIIKPTSLKPKVIKRTITTELGSCLGSFGKVSVVLTPISMLSSPAQTMANFNVTLKNASNVLQTLDAGGTSLSYSFSNLLPGAYTVTTTYNWVLVSNPSTIVTSVTLTETVYVDSKISWDYHNQTAYSTPAESLYKAAPPVGTATALLGNSTTSNTVLASGASYVDFRLNQNQTGTFIISAHALNWSNPSGTSIPAIPNTEIAFIRVGSYYGVMNLGTGSFVANYLPTDKFRYQYTLSTGVSALNKLTPTGSLGVQLYSGTSLTGRTNLTAYVGLGNVLNRGFYNMSTNMACSTPNIYAKLERRLTGTKYKVYSNKFYFFYDEEYASTASLTYNVYDKKNTVVLNTSTQVLTQTQGLVNREYGDNRYSLNVTSLATGSYVLEVINEKGEKLYLRFTK